MAKGMPNLTALLGLLALAGYKNRDKIAEMLSKAQQSIESRTSEAKADAPPKEIANELGGLFGGATAGGTLAGGLGELIERFKGAGQAGTADSWVGAGANQPVREDSLEQVLGNDTLADLTAKTGLSKQEILARLSSDLPNVVNDFTPNGRLPTAQEAAGFR